MQTPILETERLILRKIQKTDINDIFNCWMQDEDVSRYMWWKASDDIVEAEKFVQFELGQIDNDNWNRWIIVESSTEEIIGTCLIYWNDEESEPHWDVSYNLGKKYWGKGYATEAMHTALTYAKEKLNMSECITSYAKVNATSANVLHKLGFVDERTIPYECNGGEIVTEGIVCRYKSV